MRRGLSLVALVGAFAVASSANSEFVPTYKTIKSTSTSKANRDSWNFVAQLNPIGGVTEAAADAALAALVPTTDLDLVLQDASGDVDTVTFDADECSLSRSGKSFKCRTTGAVLNVAKVRTYNKNPTVTRALTGNKTKAGSSKTLVWNLKVPTAHSSVRPSMHASTYSPTHPLTHVPPHRPRAASANASSRSPRTGTRLVWNGSWTPPTLPPLPQMTAP